MEGERTDEWSEWLRRRDQIDLTYKIHDWEQITFKLYSPRLMRIREISIPIRPKWDTEIHYLTEGYDEKGMSVIFYLEYKGRNRFDTNLKFYMFMSLGEDNKPYFWGRVTFNAINVDILDHERFNNPEEAMKQVEKEAAELPTVPKVEIDEWLRLSGGEWQVVK